MLLLCWGLNGKICRTHDERTSQGKLSATAEVITSNCTLRENDKEIYIVQARNYKLFGHSCDCFVPMARSRCCAFPPCLLPPPTSSTPSRSKRTSANDDYSLILLACSFHEKLKCQVLQRNCCVYFTIAGLVTEDKKRSKIYNRESQTLWNFYLFKVEVD